MHSQGVEPGHCDDGETSSGDIACKGDEAKGAGGKDGVAIVCAC